MVKDLFKTHSIERKLFLAAVILFVFSVVSYAVTLGGAINHAVTRRATEEEVAVLRARVALFESTYFTRVNGIDGSVATILGFMEARSVAYVARTRPAPTLSLNARP